MDAIEQKENIIPHSEFKILTERVDTMESSIGNIVNRVNNVLSFVKFNLKLDNKYLCFQISLDRFGPV